MSVFTQKGFVPSLGILCLKRALKKISNKQTHFEPNFL